MTPRLTADSAGSISRPAPADNVAARTAGPSSTTPAGSADGFDVGDAAIGAGFALSVGLLLLGAARVARGYRLVAQR